MHHFDAARQIGFNTGFIASCIVTAGPTCPLTTLRCSLTPDVNVKLLDSRAATSIFYGALVFSPVFCAGLLFSRSFRRSSSAASDFGANLLGAMVGGVGEYLSLVSGYRFLLIVVAGCYLGAVIADRPSGSVRL